MPALLKPKDPGLFDGLWKTPEFRRVVVKKLQELIQKSGSFVRLSSNEIENVIFHRAQNQSQYFAMMVRLGAHFRDIYLRRNGTARVGGNAQGTQRLPTWPVGRQLRNVGVPANRNVGVPANRNVNVPANRNVGVPANRSALTINQRYAAIIGQMQVPPNQHGTVINQRCRATLIAIAQVLGGMQISTNSLGVFINQNISVGDQRRRAALIAIAQGELQIPPNIVRDPPNQNIPVINQRRRAVLLAIAEVVAGMQVSPNVTGVPPNRNIPAINQRHTPDNANAQGQMQAPSNTMEVPPNQVGGIQDQIVPQNNMNRQQQ